MCHLPADDYHESSFIFHKKLSPGPSNAVGSESAGPGVSSLIPAQSHTFLEIDHEIISKVILLLPLIQEGLLSVHKVLVNPLDKLAQGKGVVR